MFELFARNADALAGSLLPMLMDLAVKSSVVLAIAIAIGFAFRRVSAAQRHLAWTLTLVAVLAIPALGAVLPSWGVPIQGLPFADQAVVDRAPAVPQDAQAARGVGSVDIVDVAATPASVGRAASAASASSASVVPPVPPVSAVSQVPPVPAVPQAPAVSPASASHADGVTAATVAPMVRGGGASAHGTSDVVAAAGSRTVLTGWPLWVLAAWGLGVVGLLGRMIVHAVRLGRIEQAALRITDPRVLSRCRWATERLNLSKDVLLLEGDDDAIPMTWGIDHAVVVLPAGTEEWSNDRLDSVLLHELGHVKRHDYAAHLVAGLACAIHWFNPLVWVVEHRMRVERELACDDLVMQAGRDSADYAEDLLALAATFRPGDWSERATVGMAGAGDLRARLEAILDGTRDRSPISGGRLAVTGGLMAALTVAVASASPAATRTVDDQAPTGSGQNSIAAAEAAPTVVVAPPAAVTPSEDDEAPLQTGASRRDLELPALSIPPLASALEGAGEAFGPPLVVAPRFGVAQEGTPLCGPGDGERKRRSSSWNNDDGTIETEYENCSSEIRIRGKIQFTEDFTRIASLEGGASFRAEVERGGSTRRVDARPGAGGRPEYQLTVNGQNAPFDAAAERWLEAVLLELFRSSSYMAKERATYLLDSGGTTAVLDEVELMLSDHAQAVYLSIVIESGRLTSSEVRRIIETAGTEIESDHSLGTVLLSVAEAAEFDAPTRSAFVRAAESIESDHMQGQVFEVALSRGDLSAEDLNVLLRTAGTSIESDHTLSHLLIELAGGYGIDGDLRGPYLEAARQIESDHNMGMVFETLLQQTNVSTREMAVILEASTAIESDHTLSNLLIQMAERGIPDASVRGAYLEAARSIESDHSLGATLEAFAEMDGLGQSDLIALLQTSSSIGSDHTLGSLLIRTAELHRIEGDVRSEFIRAADGIGSSHTRRQVEESISRP